MSKVAFANIDRKARIVKALFSTPGGKEVLAILSETFDSDDLRGATVEETYYRLGQRDTVVYLNQLIRRNLDEEAMDESAFKDKQ